MNPETVFDLLIGLLLLTLAWKSLSAEHLYQSAILFIGFGLALALAWARLSAPDVALAEAAIGAGLLGVLLINSLRVFERSAVPTEAAPGSRGDDRHEAEVATGMRALIQPGVASKAVVLVLGVIFTVFLVMAILGLPSRAGMTGVVAEQMSHSGVQHPVTAVLLNFRGFDTWLEVGVLLIAMFGIFCAGGYVGFRGSFNPQEPALLLSWLVWLLVPVVLVVGAYLLWLGKFASGGAFQAGVVLGAAVILLRLGGRPVIAGLPAVVWMSALVFGFGLFLVFGLTSLALGAAFLEYPFQPTALILLMEVGATLSIGFTLACFYEYLAGPGSHEITSKEDFSAEEGEGSHD